VRICDAAVVFVKGSTAKRVVAAEPLVRLPGTRPFERALTARIAFKPHSGAERVDAVEVVVDPRSGWRAS
jgi:hypothetical protein